VRPALLLWRHARPGRHSGAPYAREPRKLPAVLSGEEVIRFLEAVSSLKARVALTTAYAAGLRVSEVTSRKITDIDSGRMVIMRWIQRYVPEFEKRWNRFACEAGRASRVDETYVKIKGRWSYLYHAVDSDGKAIASVRASLGRFSGVRKAIV
jgi:integrase